MSAREVLERFGTFGLLRFVMALLLFVVLHMVRLPFVVMARLLDTAMSRVDQAVTAAVSSTAHPAGPAPGAARGSAAGPVMGGVG